MDAVELVGSIAAALSMFTFLPQAIRVIRTGDTAAISLTTYVIVVLSTAIWCVYGVMIASIPVVAANVVNGSFGLFVMFRKLASMRAGS